MLPWEAIPPDTKFIGAGHENLSDPFGLGHAWHVPCPVCLPPDNSAASHASLPSCLAFRAKTLCAPTTPRGAGPRPATSRCLPP
jgi:hypothetical protein